MTKTKISAEVVADSLSPQGDRLTSLLITFPRIILAEVNTHRMLSKNTSSSRAIPFKKMVEVVENNPFIPVAWQKHHSSMQGNEYITDKIEIENCRHLWMIARDHAIEDAMRLNSVSKVTKQLCNRLLEPFMWTTMLITGSKEGWDNFFELRNPAYEYKGEFFQSKKDCINSYTFKQGFEEDKNYLTSLSDLDWLHINKGQAEIHLMDLAEKIYDVMNESTPKQLKAGEWHIPFGDKLNKEKISELEDNFNHSDLDQWEIPVKISTAMGARTSYTVVGDEKEVDYERMIGLHDRLISQNPPHSSPMEHCARAMSDEEYQSFIKGKGIPDYNLGISSSNPVLTFRENEKGWCRNFKGFIQYRHLVEKNLIYKRL